MPTRFLALVFLLFSSPALAVTWYVRTDGGTYGTTSTTCNGQTDAAYVEGNGPNCAVNHPFEILGVQSGAPKATQISGGDTIIIKNGSYRMGYTAGTYEANKCSSSWTYDCFMDEIPSGVDVDNKTKIYGEGWDSGCSTKPELWGVGHTARVFNLDGSSNVDIRCLDITDHDDCGANYASFTCGTGTDTNSLAAERGIYAYNGSNVSLTDVDVHGFARQGILAGKMTAFTATDVTVHGNAMAGIDQDTTNSDDSWAGSNTFTRVDINWNGCSENYPVDGTYVGCTDQNDTGYGDGWGSPANGTSGSFTFEDCEFRYNTSDALDLLYHDEDASVLTVESTWFEGNVGQAVKLGGGDGIVRNSLVIANCGYFDNHASVGPNFSLCRAGGNALVLNMAGGADMDVVNSTIVGEPDILIASLNCEALGETLNVKNNILVGTTQWGGGDTVSWQYSYNGCDGSELTGSNNVIYGVKEASPCDGQSNCSTADPLLTTVNFTTEQFDLLISSGASPAVNTGLAAATAVGNTTVPSDDYLGLTRDASVDMGAYEYGAESPPPPEAEPSNRASGVTFSGVNIQ